MTEHRSKSPLTPVEQLANLYASLADDVFDIPLEVDEDTKERASFIARGVLDKVIASGLASGSAVDTSSLPAAGSEDAMNKSFSDVPPDSNGDTNKPVRPTKPPRHS
jgi:hypothetical protein